MDAMYRRKSRRAETAANTNRHTENGTDTVCDPKLSPRHAHPDSVDSQKRIKGNLKQLNKRLVNPPVAVQENEAVQETETALEAGRKEDLGVRVKTKIVASAARIPYGYIGSLVLLMAALMYVMFLFVQVQEYSRSIAEMEGRIASLKEESTRLEVELESKYDLDEVERIATQEYGMVVSSTLPKKYISVSEEEDVWQKIEKEEPETSLWERIVTGLKTFFGKTEE